MSASAKSSHPLNKMESRLVPKDRKFLDQWFRWFCIAVASLSIVILGILLTTVAVQGIGWLNWHFLTHHGEPKAEEAGIYPAMWGTIWICVVCGMFALPIGVATAVFLEEFKPTGRILRALHSFIQLNISNLAGVPSVVYGILGLTLFVNMFGILGSANDPALSVGVKHYDQFFSVGDKQLRVPVADLKQPLTVVTEGMKALNIDDEWVEVTTYQSRRNKPKDPEAQKYALKLGKEGGRIDDPYPFYFRLPFGRSVLAGSLTLMLVILPIVIISSQEALRAVPRSQREAGLGMGATPWQVVRNVTLPAAVPGIMTGSILSMSRAMGEAAPLLILAGAIFITNPPENLMDAFTVMPLQIFDWAGRPQKPFHHIAASGIILLLAILFVFNLTAVLIRQFAQKKLS